jgi:hypothetical protein
MSPTEVVIRTLGVLALAAVLAFCACVAQGAIKLRLRARAAQRRWWFKGVMGLSIKG